MGLNKVHCFGFLGVFAVVSGIVSFAAYDSLYDYIMKMVSNWKLKHSPHMNGDDRSSKNSSQSLISELNIFWNLNLNVFIVLIHLSISFVSLQDVFLHTFACVYV